MKKSARQSEYMEPGWPTGHGMAPHSKNKLVGQWVVDSRTSSQNSAYVDGKTSSGESEYFVKLA